LAEVGLEFIELARPDRLERRLSWEPTWRADVGAEPAPWNGCAVLVLPRHGQLVGSLVGQDKASKRSIKALPRGTMRCGGMSLSK